MVGREVDGPQWVVLGRSRGLWVVLGSLASPGTSVGGLGQVFVPLLAVLGALGAFAYVGGLGPLLGLCGRSWPLLGPLFAVLGRLGPKSGPAPTGRRSWQGARHEAAKRSIKSFLHILAKTCRLQRQN